MVRRHAEMWDGREERTRGTGNQGSKEGGEEGPRKGGDSDRGVLPRKRVPRAQVGAGEARPDDSGRSARRGEPGKARRTRGAAARGTPSRARTGTARAGQAGVCGHTPNGSKLN